MKTIENEVDLAEIVARLNAVEPDDGRLWGVMSAPEMICHLRGAFLVAMGEAPVAPVPLPIPRKLLKVAALSLPMSWPKAFRTPPELRRGAPTMQPGDFGRDRAHVITQLTRFRQPEQTRVDHCMMGPMSYADWMRWGYLHTDHHLRQFGR